MEEWPKEKDEKTKDGLKETQSDAQDAGVLFKKTKAVTIWPATGVGASSVGFVEANMHAMEYANLAIDTAIEDHAQPQP